jgi:hypothetical protein
MDVKMPPIIYLESIKSSKAFEKKEAILDAKAPLPPKAQLE